MKRFAAPRGRHQKPDRRHQGWGSHMLDGVPFELRWKPRQLPSRPKSPPPVQPQLLNSWSGRDYDFGLEHRVLFPPEAAAEEEAAKKRQQQEKADASAADAKADAATSKSSKSSVKEDSQPARKNGYLPHQKAPPQSHSQSSINTFNMSQDPLKPQPVVPASTVNAAADRAPLNITSLKDFDRIDDPFDEAELGTIDDMAELKNVLSGVAARGYAVDVSDDSSSGGGGQSNRSPVASVHEITFPKLSLGPDSPTSSELPNTSTTLPAESIPPPMQSVPPPPPPPPVSSASSTAPMSNLPQLSNPLPQQTRPIWSSSMSFAGGSLGAAAANLRSSSYPELASTATAGQHQTPGKTNATSAPSTKQSGPDPYPELGVLERVKADSLCAMGFPRDRAARAVARLGMSDAELVAYLCGVDRVVESCGVSPPDAENAIRMLGSEAKAIRYLLLRDEMLEFGFSADDIAAAAVAANLDRDRTVALLLKQNGLSL